MGYPFLKWQLGTKKMDLCFWQMDSNPRDSEVCAVGASDVTASPQWYFAALPQSDVMCSAFSRAKRTSLAKQTSRPEGTSRSAQRNTSLKNALLTQCVFLAEAVGFEPTSPWGLPDFESGPLWPLRYASVFCCARVILLCFMNIVKCFLINKQLRHSKPTALLPLMKSLFCWFDKVPALLKSAPR